MQAVGDVITYGFVMENADDGCAAGFGFSDQFDYGGAVFGVQRGGRFVEQQNGVVDDKATGDVDALLFAAGEGRWRKAPQAFRHVQTGEQTRGFSGAGFTRYAGIEQRLHYYFQRRNARDNAQKLAHPANGGFADFHHFARWRSDQVYPLVTVFDLDLPFIGR